MEASLVSSVIMLLLALLLLDSAADPIEDKRALLDFINSMPHGRILNWREDSPVCYNWTGIICNADNSRVLSVRLPGVGLNGQIPPNTLSRLSALRILSLRSNGLTGPFPLELTRIETLTMLFLQSNQFTGLLPSNLSVWKNLTVLNLSFNAFNGNIPSSISNLTKLTSLDLSNNSLSGELPDLVLPNLQLLIVANNSLTGTVPRSLARFPSSSFAGNNLTLVLPPLPPSPTPSPVSPSNPSSSKHKKLGESTILAIVVGGCVVVFVLLAVLVLAFCSKKKGKDGVSGKSHKIKSSPEKAGAASRSENNKLVFFEGCSYLFDLEDLLRASAEVLGKGTFGTAYKAVLEDATMVVVKRLKEVSVGKREFEQQMEMVGRIKHENVAELRAYYYSKDEKLMVYDYYTHGSVSSLLHGNRGSNRIPLDWDTRLRIALGTARGIARIHAENSGKLVHGNIKSSNIFLNSDLYGCVSDLGLAMLMNPLAPPLSRAAGYRSPEVTDTRKATQPSDIFSFGVLLLELLTGKSPVQTSAGGEVIHLVRWVHSVVREEWTGEVFDIELTRYPNIEEEMVQMLQIGMACVVRMPEQRPKITEVVRLIEDVRRFDHGNQSSLEVRSDSSGQTPVRLDQSPVQL